MNNKENTSINTNKKETENENKNKNIDINESNKERTELVQKINEVLLNKTLIIILFCSLTILTLIFNMLHLEFDVTRNKANSISKEAKSIVKSFDIKEGELSVKYFCAITNSDVDNDVKERIEKIFNELEKYNKKIKYEIIDLDKQANALVEYPMADTKCILIKYKEHYISIPFEMFVSTSSNTIEINAEKVIIDEFIKLKDESNYDIYYTINHEEKFDSEEFSDFNILVSNLGYNAIPLDLSNDIPTNASTLYIIAPKKDFSEEEINKLKNFIASGNSLYISLASISKEGSKYLIEYPNLKEFCHSFGINIVDQEIKDQIQDTKLIGVYSPDDEETLKMEELNPIVYMPSSRMINIVQNDKYATTVSMISGELSSYPLVIKLTNENTKILVSASSDMLSNTYLTNNKIFASYLVKWVDNFTTNTNIQSFVYKDYIANASEFKPALILGIIEIMIPGLALYFGYEVWRKRKQETKNKNLK